MWEAGNSHCSQLLLPVSPVSRPQPMPMRFAAALRGRKEKCASALLAPPNPTWHLRNGLNAHWQEQKYGKKDARKRDASQQPATSPPPTLVVSAMASKVSARKAKGTGWPGFQVASDAASNPKCSAAALMAPVPTPSTCGACWVVAVGCEGGQVHGSGRGEREEGGARAARCTGRAVYTLRCVPGRAGLRVAKHPSPRRLRQLLLPHACLAGGLYNAK